MYLGILNVSEGLTGTEKKRRGTYTLWEPYWKDGLIKEGRTAKKFEDWLSPMNQRFIKVQMWNEAGIGHLQGHGREMGF